MGDGHELGWLLNAVVIPAQHIRQSEHPVYAELLGRLRIHAPTQEDMSFFKVESAILSHCLFPLLSSYIATLSLKQSISEALSVSYHCHICYNGLQVLDMDIQLGLV